MGPVNTAYSRNHHCMIHVRISAVKVRTQQVYTEASNDHFYAVGLWLRAPLQRLDMIHQEGRMSYIRSKLV